MEQGSFKELMKLSFEELQIMAEITKLNTKIMSNRFRYKISKCSERTGMENQLRDAKPKLKEN